MPRPARMTTGTQTEGPEVLFDAGGAQLSNDEIRDMSRANGLAKLYASGVKGGARALTKAERAMGMCSLLYLTINGLR